VTNIVANCTTMSITKGTFLANFFYSMNAKHYEGTHAVVRMALE